MTDLFHRLQINHASGEIPGERVDIGWRAWASRAPIKKVGSLRFYVENLQFWLAVWRFFGQQRVLIQVDNHYLTATSASITANDQGSISVTLMQRTTILGHFFRYVLWRRKSPLHSTRMGNDVRISFSSSIPTELPKKLSHCPEALLDGDSALSLPLHITRYISQ